MKDDQNERRPKWKKTKMEDDQNKKMTKMEDEQIAGRGKLRLT